MKNKINIYYQFFRGRNIVEACWNNRNWNEKTNDTVITGYWGAKHYLGPHIIKNINLKTNKITSRFYRMGITPSNFKEFKTKKEFEKYLKLYAFM